MYYGYDVLWLLCVERVRGPHDLQAQGLTMAWSGPACIEKELFFLQGRAQNIRHSNIFIASGDGVISINLSRNDFCFIYIYKAKFPRRVCLSVWTR